MFDLKYNKAPDLLNSCLMESAKWFSLRKEIKEKINDYFSAFEELQFATPLNDIEHGFIPPWLYLFNESEQELDSVVVLMLVGSYKDSLRALRSFIELNLLGLYYFTKQDFKEFQQWLSGDIETPRRKYIVDYLLSNNGNIAKLENLQWSINIGNLYKELSRFIHTSGRAGSFISLRSGNNLMFSEKGLKYVITKLFESMKLVSMARIANFPLALQPLPMFEKFGFNDPASGFLDNWQVGLIRKIFEDDKRSLMILQQISDSDANTQSVVKEINSKKDLTGDKIAVTLDNYIKSLDPKEQKKLLKNIKGKDIPCVFAMIKAMQKAFIRVSIPLINESYLNLRNNLDYNKKEE